MKNTITIVRVGIILAVLLAATTTVYAAFTYGTVTGPTWTRPGYQFTIPVTLLDNPDKSVCIAYSVNTVAQTPVSCTCSGTNCSSGVGTYTCTIPTNSASATITWDISSYTANNGCTGKSTQGPTGSFTTGPTAMTLATFDAQPQPASWLLPIGLALLAGTIVIFFIRRRRAQ
jgi:LPXTG-motif cell wall-anchored protein